MTRPGRMLAACCLVPALLLLAGAAREARLSTLAPEVERLLADQEDLTLGVHVWVEGEGEIYSRLPDEPRAAASSIKTVVALDLLISYGGVLETIPAGVDGLLQPGSHPAFSGFTRLQLGSARRDLKGKSYWDLALVMMGQTADVNEVYNAACNLLMVKLGGPEAIQRRVQALAPAFQGFDINRYMKTWNGDGDNRATPRALVDLYRGLAAGSVPGLDEPGIQRLRMLLHQAGEGTAGSVFEKGGTLFPKPMVRVHAGFVEQADGDIIYAVMGEVPDGPSGDPSERFVRLMNGVDGLTARCTGWIRRGGP